MYGTLHERKAFGSVQDLKDSRRWRPANRVSTASSLGRYVVLVLVHTSLASILVKKHLHAIK